MPRSISLLSVTFHVGRVRSIRLMKKVTEGEETLFEQPHYHEVPAAMLATDAIVDLNKALEDIGWPGLSIEDADAVKSLDDTRVNIPLFVATEEDN